MLGASLPERNNNPVFDTLFSPAYAPFAIAFVVMVGIGLVEAIGLGVGQLNLDSDANADFHGGNVLDWLGFGDLPILISLTSLLACFTLTGIAVQQVVTAAIGTPLGAWPASGCALLTGGFLNGFVAKGLARVLPGYESTVVSSDDFIRLRGTILEGTARRGHPARAKVVDQHGQSHYIMVEPHDDEDVIAQGETALIVKRDGTTFYALPDANRLLRSI